MSEHSWCRDVSRDEAVRAAEDAAAVPTIQHRDLPEQVALLWASLTDIIGRVVRIEGEIDAGEAAPAAPPEPRGWLTAEEREAVLAARDYFDNDDHGDSECVFIARMLKQILARSTPPRVKVPEYQSDSRARDCQWIAAIRAAGGEVEW